MEPTLVFGVLGFFMAAYAVIANDSAQTLGTFIASNKGTKWQYQWLTMATVMVATLTYGYMSGDIAHGRLNSIPLPETFQWYHLAAPALLLSLTRFGVPVSTTILTLSVFSSSFVLEKILVKSALGYALAAVSAYVLWTVISKFLDEKEPVSEENKSKWRVAQWAATCFLWHQWLAHDVANVAVFLPRGEGLPVWMFVGFMCILVAGLAQLFHSGGGKIQEIVLSKSGTRFMRSATIIDFAYALILWYFKQYNDIPMSTTWVFVGLLCGRELAVYRHFKSEEGIKVVFPMLVADFMKMMVGLALSVVLVWVISL
ncbi:TPA: hypothetical protein HA278_01830 [Candidatus Woesearchaeota archaeon]|nr:hypothetical protein [Candidatus Woesearchaeota archaeon]